MFNIIYHMDGKRSLSDSRKYRFFWNYALFSPLVFAAVFTWVGFISPGYDHLVNTISRLSVEKYGWIQQVNILQFGFGLLFFGLVLAAVTDDEPDKKTIKKIFYFCLLLAVLIAAFPTDPIDNFHDLTKASYKGHIHWILIISFFFMAPFGVKKLADSLKAKPELLEVSGMTQKTGYAVVFLSFLWVGFFISGLFTPYRGVMQKFIALIVIIWQETVLFKIKGIRIQDN